MPGCWKWRSARPRRKQAILVDPSTGLSILPSTAIKQAEIITELMFSDRIVDVLDHLRHRYELIMIDSPPLVPLVDGRALAELADRIILALAWDQTPGEVLSHAMSLLSPVSDRIWARCYPGRSQPAAVLRLLSQFGVSQALWRPRACMPEPRREDARTDGRIDGRPRACALRSIGARFLQ